MLGSAKLGVQARRGAPLSGRTAVRGRRARAALLGLSLLALAPPALGVVNIDWVVIASPGNPGDPQSQGVFGSVPYTYRISRNEVSNAHYTEFLNAVAASDPAGLYTSQMESDVFIGGIVRSGSSGSYSYATKPGMQGEPVAYVSFWDALRYANWLQNGQPTGAQDDTTTEDGAYTITPTGITANDIVRNSGATIFVPDEDEWYKAAYYDRVSSYFVYPTGSSTLPVCALPPTDTGNTANCWPASSPDGSLTPVGSYPLSASPYGTHDQGGNLWEWIETIAGLGRVLRGGSWGGGFGDPFFMQASVRFSEDGNLDLFDVGFRVAGSMPPCGVDPDCDDGNACTNDVCNADTCEYAFNTDPCDDGLACTSADVCSLGICSGADSCTGGQTCDPGSGVCVDCLSDPDCDDADVCTDDRCNAGVCEFAFNTDPCDDGVACTSGDACGAGTCAGADACTGGELCNLGTGLCEGGFCNVDPDCDDGNLCTDDVCIDNACTYPFNTLPCDDGLGCTDMDTCAAGVCVAQDTCTTGETCSPTQGICQPPGLPKPVVFQWATLGEPGNPGDPQSQGSFGSVPRVYQIGRTEVTNAQYTDFLNAVGASDANGLYNANMDSDPIFGGITRTGASGSYVYAAKPGLEGHPVVYVGFHDAARFANWLHNDQPVGAQDATTTEDGAYTITAQGITNNSIQRNAGARYSLPSEDEWFKAAYYDVEEGLYYDFPTGTDASIACVPPASDDGNSGNCWPATSPGALVDVGSYPLSASPSGTFDQAGNVWEWSEAIEGGDRVIRGAAWGTDFSTAFFTQASVRFTAPANQESDDLGFRVARAPLDVPALDAASGALLFGLLAAIGAACRRTRR